MRIALIVHKFPPASTGGTEIYTLNLARGLAAQGHAVFVFYRDDRASALGSAEPWEEREGFRAFRISRPVHRFSSSAIARFMDTFWNPDVEEKFARFLDETQPHIVHVQHLMTLSFRLIAQAKRRGMPVVLTLHDYWFLCGNAQLIWPDGRVCRGKAMGLNCGRCALANQFHPLLAIGFRPAAAVLMQIRDHLVWRAMLQADRWIAPSQFLIQKYVQAGLPRERVLYLENGIDIQRIRRYAWRPSPDGRVRFTYLGALAWQKGVHVAVEAFRGLPADRAVLRIYGDPHRFPDYVERLRRLADPATTSFEGPVSNDEVGRVLAETDVLLVPSLWYENSPVVIQEALAAGVPVIASDLGALAEKIRPGVNGWLCPPGNVLAWRSCIWELLNHGLPREKLRMHEANPLSLEEHIFQIYEIYRSIFKSL
ncbi:glycosyltransferase family 4 protein [Thermoflexus sp.]|uniref:glycosyltransferase family 4 protein n=1 Tax=Thermoflexus sp. TaxID=1969742 RepID=UPI002ADDD6FE|nr:glycosyltransferase family 4 protein [Thermoflexus sp.]